MKFKMFGADMSLLSAKETERVGSETRPSAEIVAIARSSRGPSNSASQMSAATCTSVASVQSWRLTVTRRMDAEGTDAVGGTPQQFATEVKAEFEKWRGLARKLGLDRQG